MSVGQPPTSLGAENDDGAHVRHVRPVTAATLSSRASASCHPERQPPVIPSVSLLSSRASASCHPERQRGIFSPALVASHENGTLDPSLTLGMTEADARDDRS